MDSDATDANRADRRPGPPPPRTCAGWIDCSRGASQSRLFHRLPKWEHVYLEHHVATHPFLSDEWIAAAREIRAEFAERLPATPFPVMANLVVEEVPFGEGSLQAHIDTTGEVEDIDLGHIDAAELVATIDYATAKALIVDADPAVALQAFMQGKVKIEGDVTKLMALQASPLDESAIEMAERIQAITAD